MMSSISAAPQSRRCLQRVSLLRMLQNVPVRPDRRSGSSDCHKPLPRALGKISIAADKSVSGMITTTGITGTMAHIHEGAPGKNVSTDIHARKRCG